MMWFQNGKLWPSRVDAQEAMIARGEMGRRGDARQGGGFRERHKVGARPPARRSFSEGGSAPPRERSDRRERPEWSPKSQTSRPKPADKLEWKPKGEFTPAPKRSDRSEWKPRPEKREWKPRGEADRRFRPKPSSYAKAPADRQAPKSRLEWTPKSSTYAKAPVEKQAPGPTSPEKRKWIPKEEYKKSQGIEAKRDAKWRPGGEHRDPRQKYKDAKKAKWTKVKKTIRTRWETKNKKKS
jgi:hypothetical protein